MEHVFVVGRLLRFGRGGRTKRVKGGGSEADGIAGWRLILIQGVEGCRILVKFVVLRNLIRPPQGIEGILLLLRIFVIQISLNSSERTKRFRRRIGIVTLGKRLHGG